MAVVGTHRLRRLTQGCPRSPPVPPQCPFAFRAGDRRISPLVCNRSPSPQPLLFIQFRTVYIQNVVVRGGRGAPGIAGAGEGTPPGTTTQNIPFNNQKRKKKKKKKPHTHTHTPTHPHTHTHTHQAWFTLLFKETFLRNYLKASSATWSRRLRAGNAETVCLAGGSPLSGAGLGGEGCCPPAPL